MGAPTQARVRRPSAETREHILDVATELFYWKGIHATGVDRVAQAAGIGPTTLYRLFASKDDLVTAYVERAAAGYRAEILRVTATGDAGERILALFDATLVAVRPENCRGCPFLMALAEYPAGPVHDAAVAVKAWVRDRLRELAADDVLADQLTLLLEGVYASVQALTADGPPTQARAAAETLIAAR